MRLVTLFSVGVCLLAQNAIQAPSVGWMRDAAGAYRQVFGVAGSFTLGSPQQEPPQLEIVDQRRLARRADRIEILRMDGAVLDSLPSTAGPVLLTAHGVLYADEVGVTLRRPDSGQMHFAVQQARQLRLMSADWLQVVTDAGSFALRLERGHESLFMLPDVKVEVRRR
jgi:hypothetical protein